jgi:micrococcal nuclease
VRQFTSSIAFGKDVKVEIEGVDRYGRTVGDVILPDGRRLSHEILRVGLGWWFRRYAPHHKELESFRKVRQRGAPRHMGYRDPIPTWEWRRLKRQLADVN